MPVYGKKSVVRQKLHEKGQTSIPLHEQKILRQPSTFIADDRGNVKFIKGKRKLGQVIPQPSANSSLETVERRCAVRDKLTARISLGELKPVIFDWGCGEGVAITTLAEKFPTAQCYAYSRDYYEQWNLNDKVKFIQAPVGELKKYIKSNSVDVIYSYSGMIYLTPEKQIAELHALIPKLKIGGCILLDIGTPSVLKELKKIKGIELKVKEDDSIEIKKVK